MKVGIDKCLLSLCHSDYFACLRDFYKLSGLFRLPRYALETGGAGIGNTVKKATLELLTEFEKEIYHFPLLLWIWTGI